MDFEEVERENLESEGASARFVGSDTLFHMESDYDACPELPKVVVKTDRFIQLTKG